MPLKASQIVDTLPNKILNKQPAKKKKKDNSKSETTTLE